MLLYNPFKYDKCIRVDGGFCRGALCQPPKLFRRRASVKVVKCVIPPVEVLNAKIDFRAYVHHIDSRAACLQSAIQCSIRSNNHIDSHYISAFDSGDIPNACDRDEYFNSSCATRSTSATRYFMLAGARAKIHRG